jgi:cell wall-associated NlpC family hydrolase
MDRRTTPFSGRIAHQSLRGQVQAEAFVPGEPLHVLWPVVALCRAPDGAIDRQLLRGDAIVVIDRQDGWAYGQSDRGGYCGWLPESAVGAAAAPTHWVAALSTHAYAEPRVQAEPLSWLSMGAKLHVRGMTGIWADTDEGFIPARHLRAIGHWADDPVAVAEMFLGVPYLWGGNTVAGLDCSGLVQAAWMAAGRACPGDSDLQRSLGADVVGEAVRGDLIFWKGHVAIVTGPDRIIHANGHTMNVAHEGLADAIARIRAAEGADVLARRRV